MKLSMLFNGQPDVEITGVSIDSRKTKEGDIFFCMEGLETDGHKFAKVAADKGAVAIVHSKDIEHEDGVVYIKSRDMVADVNRVCNVFNGRPSDKMTVFGVTGTNGKTTTTSIIRDIYSLYKPCGYMGTIAVRYGDVSKIPSLTTPDQIELYENLKDMVDYGMEAVAMEVSSHGLAMGRCDDVDFDYAIFTNLTYDHLDYHKTMENYFEAKKLLFEHMKKDGLAVLNVDDKSFEELAKACSCRYVTYGAENDADYKIENVQLSNTGTKFTLNIKGVCYELETNLVALYNIYNLVGAIAAMHESGMEIESMREQVQHVSQIDGRMEIIEGGQDFNLIVDYAHTPDGFDKIFEYAKAITPNGGKIYSVFGCAGKRDHAKRAVLGRIAGKHCDKVYVTEEDPRTEDATVIGKEIMSGIEDGNCVFILDRYEAIKEAILNAKKDDCVLILGKGDEPYMYYAEGRRPWMGDQKAAEKVVREGYVR